MSLVLTMSAVFACTPPLPKAKSSGQLDATFENALTFFPPTLHASARKLDKTLHAGASFFSRELHASASNSFQTRHEDVSNLFCKPHASVSETCTELHASVRTFFKTPHASVCEPFNIVQVRGHYECRGQPRAGTIENVAVVAMACVGKTNHDRNRTSVTFCKEALHASNRHLMHPTLGIIQRSRAGPPKARDDPDIMEMHRKNALRKAYELHKEVYNTQGNFSEHFDTFSLLHAKKL